MRVNIFLVLIVSLVMASCAKESNDIAMAQQPVKVGFFAGSTATRTSINNDGLSTSWSKTDKIALWANASDGTAVLSAEPFGIYYRETPATLAMFTANLDQPMDEDTYTYYATYPTPKSVAGTQATFTLPTTQDGTISGGAAIMVATPTQGKQLGIVTGSPNSPDDAYEIDDNHLSLTMSHAMHALKFFVMQNKWGFDEGETIERISFVMPQNIAGDVTLDYTNPNGAISVANGSNIITLNLKNTIGATTSAANPDFAAASIIPTAAFAEGDVMEMRVLATNHASRSYISLASREAMQAGHITPVSVDCSEVFERHTIRFVWSGNNLGEDVHTITFYTEAGNEIYKITDVADFMKQGRHDIDFTFEDKTYLATIAGQPVVVKYESEHAIVSNTIKMPEDVATAVKCHEIPITVPYLFEEDFSTLVVYDGDYTGGPYTSASGASTTARDLSQYGLPSGWSGARTGCDAAGTAILVSGRVDNVIAGATRAYGRLDSPALSAIRADASITVEVSFTYSGNEQENIDYYYPAAVCGYTTTSGLINGYATQFNNDKAFNNISGKLEIPSIPTSGSAATANIPMKYTIRGCTSNHRLSWHAMQYGFKTLKINNDYGWLYVDNIKVQIVPTE